VSDDKRNVTGYLFYFSCALQTVEGSKRDRAATAW